MKQRICISDFLGSIFIIIIVLEALFSPVSHVEIPAYKMAIYNFAFIAEPILLTHVAYQYDKRHFCNRFVKIVLFLAISSLVFYIIAQIDYKYLIDSGILHKVKINRLTYTDFYCNFLYVLRDREINRNVGIFCEPGLYQILLNSAIYLLIFYSKEITIRRNKLAIAILAITLVTTQSGTGFIGLAIILLGVVFSNHKIINKSIKQITLAALGLIFVLVLFDTIKNGVNSFLYIVVLEKVLNIGSNKLTTGSVRLNMITTMLHLIIHNPFGYGFSYVSYYRSIVAPESVGARLFLTCAAIGVIPVLILLFYYLDKSYKTRISNMQFIVLWLLYVNTTLAQSREFYPALLVLMILSKPKDNLCKQRDVYKNLSV